MIADSSCYISMWFVLTNWNDRCKQMTVSECKFHEVEIQTRDLQSFIFFISLIFIFILKSDGHVMFQWKRYWFWFSFIQGIYWALACIIQIYPDAKIPHIKGEPYTGNSSYEPLYTKNMPVEFMINGIVSGSLTLVNVICIFITAIITLKIKEVAAPYTSSPDLRR